MAKQLPWVVVAANVGVVLAALRAPALVVPLAVVAAILAIAVPFVTRRRAPEGVAPEVVLRGGAAPSSVPPASSLPNYELKERIASGTMGEVWLAHDGNLDRPVGTIRARRAVGPAAM